MTGKTHMLGGIASGLAVCYTLDCIGYGTTALEMAAGAMAASVLSLLPDVDEKNSTISRKLVILPMTFAILQFPVKIRLLFASKKKKAMLLKKYDAIMHRGICHYLITWGIITLMLFGLCGIAYAYMRYLQGGLLVIAALSASTGYLSPIRLDLISGKINVFGPFSSKRIGIRLFTTDGIAEKLLMRPLLLFLCGWFIYEKLSGVL